MQDFQLIKYNKLRNDSLKLIIKEFHFLVQKELLIQFLIIIIILKMIIIQ